MKHIVGGWGLTIFASLWRIAYENDMWLTTKSRNVFSNVIVFARCYWSSCQKVFCEESILKNFPKSAGKHLCWSAFLIKLKTSGWTFTKKRFLHRCFLLYFARFFRAPILYNMFGWLKIYWCFESLIVSQCLKYWFFPLTCTFQPNLHWWIPNQCTNIDNTTQVMKEVYLDTQIPARGNTGIK